MTVTLADIEAAADAARPEVAITTADGGVPLALGRMVGGPVLLKCENLQRTGSFKIRGAYVRMSRLTADERARGVVAASAGNHAQGVALAAQLLGIRATVFMPEGAPIPKVNATRGYGAEVRLPRRYLTQALVAAQEFADETGAVFIHPFDHPDIVAGQGTVRPGDPRAGARGARPCWSPTGGGGLIAGIALAIKATAPRRPGGRRSGRGGGGVPRVAERRCARWPLERDDARWPTASRWRCPGDVPFAAIAAARRRGRHRLRGIDLTGPGAAARARPSWSSSRPARRRSRRSWTTRPRSATPVVAVLSGGNVDPLLLRQADPARPGLGRSLPQHRRADPRPTRRPGPLLAELAEVRRQRARGRPRAHLRPRCTSTRSRCTSSSRPGAPTTPRAVLARLREHGYQVATSRPESAAQPVYGTASTISTSRSACRSARCR